MKRRLFLVLLLIGVLSPLAAQAADASCATGKILPPCTCSGNCQATDFVQLFINLYAFGIHVAAPLAMLFIVIGTVILVTASGYSQRIELGKTMITQAVTGLIIVLISWIIVDTAVYLITGNKDRTVFEKPWFGGFTYVCTDDNLYAGCTGGNVSSLQSNLLKLGYAVTVDGSFGAETAGAVEAFEQDANNRVYVADGRKACGGVPPSGSPEGILVWNRVFGQDCPTTCVIPQADAEKKWLQTNDGAANALTINGLKVLTNAADVIAAYKAKCKS